MDCLIAIPCFRESRRLPLFLEALCHELAYAPFTAAIVIVDDGSGHPEDEFTRSIVKQFRAKYPALIAEPVFLKRNVGKGGAVYAGWRTYSSGSIPELLCFVDADGAVPASEVGRLIGELLTDQRQRWDPLFWQSRQVARSKSRAEDGTSLPRPDFRDVRFGFDWNCNLRLSMRVKGDTKRCVCLN